MGNRPIASFWDGCVWYYVFFLKKIVFDQKNHSFDEVFEHFQLKKCYTAIHPICVAKIQHLYAWAECLQQTHPCSANWLARKVGAKNSAQLTFWQITICVQVYRRCLTIVGRCNLHIMNPYDSPSFRRTKNIIMTLEVSTRAWLRKSWLNQSLMDPERKQQLYIFFCHLQKRQDVSEIRLIMRSVVLFLFVPNYVPTYIPSVDGILLEAKKSRGFFPKTGGDSRNSFFLVKNM